MENMQPILGAGLARHSDPATSHAAGLVVAEKLGDLESLVAACLVRRGSLGATSFECAEELGLDRVTVSPRFAPMKDKGVVVKGAARRPGPSGRPGIVWYAAGLEPTGTSEKQQNV